MEGGEAIGVRSGAELELGEVEEFLKVEAEDGVVRWGRRLGLVGMGRSVRLRWSRGGGGKREPPLGEALGGCGGGGGGGSGGFTFWF